MIVVTLPLGFGQVDHTDGPAQPNHVQRFGRRAADHRRHQESRPAGLVEQFLHTPVQCPPNRLAFGDPTPFAGRGDGAGICGESDQAAIVAVSLADQLPQRQLPVSADLCGASIAYVGIVCPHHDTGPLVSVFSIEMTQQGRQRLGHVLVAKIPRGHPATEHRAVVHFRVADSLGVLPRVERFVLGKQPIPPGVFDCVLLHLDQLLDRLAFAGQTGAEGGGESVRLTVIGRCVIEARVPVPRPRRRERIHLVQVRDHLVHRTVQAVEVQTVKAGLRFATGPAPGITGMQPFHEIADDNVAPHPGGKPFEPAQRFVRCRVITLAPYKTVDAVRIGPVSFGSNPAETLFLDQPPGDDCPGFIEFVCTVRTFTDQNDACITDDLVERFRRRQAVRSVDRSAVDDVGRACSGRSPQGPQIRRGSGKDIANLLVTHLTKVPIPLADRVERGRHGGAHDVVDHAGELSASRFRSRRHRDDDLGRISIAQCLHRGEHAGAGGQAIVDEDHHFARDVDRRLTATIGGFAPNQFSAFAFSDVAQLLRRHPQRP